MPSCTFFGHRDCPSNIACKLKEVLIDLIETKNVDLFYVGNHGEFDRIVKNALRNLKTEHPHIQYAVVLAYIPKDYDGFDYSDTVFPEGIETVPKHFAISWRNEWMLNHSDYVVTYITRAHGGASKFAEKANRANKYVINLK